MPTLARPSRKSTTTPAPLAVRQAELDALVVELDAIGERHRAAELAGDEQAILGAIARERALPALIGVARRRLNEAELAQVEESLTAVTPELLASRVELEAAQAGVVAAQARLEVALARNSSAEDQSIGRWSVIWELKEQAKALEGETR